ncbi:glycosyltransferase family 4 protein [Balneolales bacterium ANBcel1]|nr:glycosyltransferase family 4 protein [Balneolales bacterium ANBcel1]
MKLIVNKTLSEKSKYGGGVGGYYRTLRKYTNHFYLLDATYSIKKNTFLRFMLEYFRAQIKLFKLQRKATVTVFNPSLGGYSWIRDLIQMRLLSTGKGKVIIFFRGWDEKFADKIEKNKLYRLIFNFVYNSKSNAFIVLSRSFQEKLHSWEVNKPVYIDSTIVDDELTAKYHHEIQVKSFNQNTRLLFLSRLERNKGVFELISAFKIVSAKRNEYMAIDIVGNGTAYAELYNSVTGISNINFHGYVIGDEKSRVFITSDIFVFPSTHGEGMPNALLEAMAFGLPVLTTRVGGIPDFFEDSKMGLFLESTDPEHIAERIEFLLDRPDLMEQMSRYNYTYAKEHFYASKVAKRLENIVDDVYAHS